MKLQNFKQRIQIITCKDHNPSQLSNGMGTKQGVEKGKKRLDANIYISSILIVTFCQHL